MMSYVCILYFIDGKGLNCYKTYSCRFLASSLYRVPQTDLKVIHCLDSAYKFCIGYLKWTANTAWFVWAPKPKP